MANHQKPTKEELEANAQAALDALENLPPEDNENENPPADPPPDKPEDDQKSFVEPQDPPKDDEKPTETKEEIDYKQKFSASSREAQRIAAANRAVNQAIDEANQIPEPTPEELTIEYPEWDDMTLTEQRLAKESLISKQFRQKIAEARQKGQKIEKWHEQVSTFVENPKTYIDNPDLDGKQEEFRLFASEEKNSNSPFELLIGAFLHQQSTQKISHKGEQMFPTGTGGSNETPKLPDDKLSVEEGRILMKTDYKKFQSLLRAGKIKNE